MAYRFPDHLLKNECKECGETVKNAIVGMGDGETYCHFCFADYMEELEREESG